LHTEGALWLGGLEEHIAPESFYAPRRLCAAANQAQL